MDSRTKSFHIKNFIDKHEYTTISKNKRLISTRLAKNIFGKSRTIPIMKLIEFQALVKEEYRVHMALSKCARAKATAFVKLARQYAKEYAKLHDYAHEMEKTNPISRVFLIDETPPLFPYLDPVFDRMYIAFDCCKKGFLVGCRKIIGLDGCFLKGLIKGEISIAIGIDGNNQMFLITWAVVLTESKDI